MNTFLYNPCSPMKNPQCNNNSLCEEKGESLGKAGFVFNNNQLSIQYVGMNILSTVNLICDRN